LQVSGKTARHLSASHQPTWPGEDLIREDPRGTQTMRQQQIVKRPTRAGRDPLDLRTPTGRQLTF
jgi:hypothetical protein